MLGGADCRVGDSEYVFLDLTFLLAQPGLV